MKKIDILGWYNRENVGDNAFQTVLSRWFCDHDVRFVTPPQHTRSDADLVILGGGAVASQYYLNQITPTPTGNVIALGVDTEWESELSLLRNAGLKFIAFRSREDYVDFHGGKLDVEPPAPNTVVHCPDLAFSLTPTGTPVLDRYRKYPKRRAVGVFLTDYVMPSHSRDLYYFGPRADQFAQGLAGALDRIAEKCEVVLVPCSVGETGNDRRINLHVAAFMRHRPTIIEDPLPPEDAIDLIADCTAVVAMRYHSHIFSLVAGTPFASVDFTKKASTILKDYSVILNDAKVSRDMTAVRRKEDKFFDFDATVQRIDAAIDAGTRDTERAISLAYARQCREEVATLQNVVLSRFVG